MRLRYKIMICAAALDAVIVFVAALGSSSGNRLDPPTVSRGQPQEEHESHASKHHADSDGNQSHTSTAPSIESDKPIIHYWVSTEPKQESEWYTTPEGWTAAFTGGLFIATFGLWIFTGLLWNATRKAVLDGNEAIKLARDEFIVTHRPRIRVRDIKFDEFYESNDLSIYLSHDDDFMINIEIVNIGESAAKIAAIRYVAAFTKKGKRFFMSYKLLYETEIAKDAIISIGESNLVILPCKAKMASIGFGMMAPRQFPNEWDLVFAGEILYEDRSGIKRLTGFCREYSDGRFKRDPENPYEYED